MKTGLKPWGRSLVIAGALILSACGFEPVYAPSGTARKSDLSHIYVDQLNHSRSGQLLRSRLLDAIGGARHAGRATHVLRFTLVETSESKVLESDGTTSRFNLTLVADFKLSRRSDGTVVRKGRVSRTTGYNIVGDDFASKVGEQDARRRLAEDLALGLRDRLIVADLN